MNDPTAVARTLYIEGRTAEAEGLLRNILGDRPDDFEALEGLGVLVLQQGRAAEAVVLFGRALAVQPDSPRLRANLGEALRTLGRLDEALEHLRRATELDPSFAQAWNSLGLLAHARGHHGYAETAYREALRLRPSLVAMYINLTNTLLARGRMGEAAEVLRDALRIQPNHAVAMMNLGRILGEMRKPELFDEAEALCRRAIDFLPDLPHAMNNLGHVLRARGLCVEAGACFERARLLAAGRPAPPVDGAAADRGPSDPSPADTAEDHHARGLIAWKYGRIEEAEGCFRQALSDDPTREASWLRLARIQEERGDFERSCESARSALAIRPKLAEAYRMLAFVLGGRMPDDDVLAMRGMLDDPDVSPQDRALIRFGLATILDHRGLFAEAAAHIEAANALQSISKAERGLAFDPATGPVFIQKLIAAFTPEFLARRRGWGDPDPRPVFVVGLPRSGTTLTEQILASHPLVHGAGELHEVSRIFRSLPDLVGPSATDAFDALERLTPESVRAAARDYLAQIDALAPPHAARVVDKQPDNINHVGLISLLWPGARVIRCHRDLRDVAVSCWKMGLVATSWSSDWDNIARRFRDYQQVLAYWEETRPLGWLEVGYEDLVGDLEGQARRMIEFLGLEWDPACLEFHSNRRVVRTPSRVQVRQPIHTNSVGRWRDYEPFIRPMFDAFDRQGIRLEPSD